MFAKPLSTQTQPKKITQLRSSSIGRLSIRAYRKRKIGHYQASIVLPTTGMSYLPCYTPALPVHFKALQIILVLSLSGFPKAEQFLSLRKTIHHRKTFDQLLVLIQGTS